MNTKIILLILLKSISIIALSLLVVFIMAKLFLPPEGTAFDRLDYILKPFFVCVLAGFIYILMSLIRKNFQKLFYFAALAISFTYSASLS